MEATKKGTSLLRHVLPQYPIALVLMLNFNASFNGSMINFYKPKNVFIDSFLLRQAIGVAHLKFNRATVEPWVKAF